jgi:hypothetical protein
MTSDSNSTTSLVGYSLALTNAEPAPTTWQLSIDKIYNTKSEGGDARHNEWGTGDVAGNPHVQ